MDEDPRGTETWIDEIATRFDRAWRAGQRPRIEDFLAEVAEPRRCQLFEELLRIEPQSARAKPKTGNPGSSDASTKVLSRQLLLRPNAASLPLPLALSRSA
jgi:hypothetical protein